MGRFTVLLYHEEGGYSAVVPVLNVASQGELSRKRWQWRKRPLSSRSSGSLSMESRSWKRMSRQSSRASRSRCRLRSKCREHRLESVPLDERRGDIGMETWDLWFPEARRAACPSRVAGSMPPRCSGSTPSRPRWTLPSEMRTSGSWRRARASNGRASDCHRPASLARATPSHARTVGPQTPISARPSSCRAARSAS